MNKFFNVFLKIGIFILIISLLMFYMSDSYSSQSLDKLAYVVAIGLDVSTSNNLKLSIQLAKPTTDSSNSSSQSSSSVINSVDCSSIESGINLLNSYISRNINLSHCKVVVISEELAKEGISTNIYNLANNLEVSSHANMIISKTNALDFLQSSNPVLEDLSARYYEVASSSSKYTGYTKTTSLIDFFSSYLDTYKEPIAILGNVNMENTHLNLGNTNNSTNRDSRYLAGQTPITSTNNIECMGIAIFKKDKLIGELNGLESICHMMVSGELKYCNLQIPDPNDKNKNIDLNIKLNVKPKNNVEIINDFAYIKTKIKLDVRVLTIDENSNYSNINEIHKLENEINKYLEDLIYKYLYKIAKEYNCDIDGLGKYAIKYFSTQEDWENYNWLNNFKNSFFNVTVDSKIKSGYNFIST